MKKLLATAAAACLVLSAASLSVFAHGGHHGWRTTVAAPAVAPVAQTQNVCASGYANCPYIANGEACPGHSLLGHNCGYDNCLYLNAADCAAHHDGSYVCPYGYGCTSAGSCHHSTGYGYGYGYGCGGGGCYR